MGYCYCYTNRYDRIGYQKMMESLGNGGKIVKKKKKQGSEEIRVDLSCCRYDILRTVIAKFGWEEVENNNNKGWHLCWTDTSIGPERLMSLRRGQKVNHFVGMLQICRKKSLARHLSTMRKLFPSLYKFSPRGYILPNQLSKFLTCFNISSPRTYILKPDNGCQGRGVVLVQSVSDVKQVLKGFPGADLLAQKYLTKPMLLNGYKFDLRIYVLILSCDSLRLYLYREGLVRFCTEKYNKPDRQNLKLSCMHLTNYAVNKKNCNFEFNVNASEVDKGNKWSLSALFDVLAMQGFNVKELKWQIRKMVVLTIISIVPLLVHSYKTCLNEDDNGRSCFELLGMDVLLDDKCKPWLLEVNHSPSFSTDTPLDHVIKEALISDTLKLIQLDPLVISKSRIQEKRGSKSRLYGKDMAEKENSVAGSFSQDDHLKTLTESQGLEENRQDILGNYEQVYPSREVSLHNMYLNVLAGSEEAFKQSFDMKVKDEIAKVQEERRQEELEKQAAEKKKLKLQFEMRKKARERARLVAVLKQQSMDSTQSNSVIDEDLIAREGENEGKSLLTVGDSKTTQKFLSHLGVFEQNLQIKEKLPSTLRVSRRDNEETWRGVNDSEDECLDCYFQDSNLLTESKIIASSRNMSPVIYPKLQKVQLLSKKTMLQGIQYEDVLKRRSYIRKDLELATFLPEGRNMTKLLLKNPHQKEHTSDDNLLPMCLCSSVAYTKRIPLNHPGLEGAKLTTRSGCIYQAGARQIFSQSLR